MKSKQGSVRWLAAFALAAGLLPALGAFAVPADIQPTPQAMAPWQQLLTWVEGWWSPADDLDSVRAAAGGGPQTGGGGGGDKGLGLDPDGTDPDPGDGDDGTDPGLPPGG